MADDRLRRALHAAVDAFCDAMAGEGTAPPPKLKRRRGPVPPENRPSDLAIARAHKDLAARGLWVSPTGDKKST